jgi:hypothetical protein
MCSASLCIHDADEFECSAILCLTAGGTLYTGRNLEADESEDSEEEYEGRLDGVIERW